ncbi:MAG: L,D-transpeptidase [Patescibacteria group bacterium]
MSKCQRLFMIIGIFLLGLKSSLMAESVEYSTYTLRRHETLENKFNKNWINVARFNKIDRVHAYPGTRLKIPQDLEKQYNPLPEFIDEEKQNEKFILINLSLQFLGTYEYGKLKSSYPVSSGRKGRSTPTGIFYVVNFEEIHYSSKYFINNSTHPYPMTWALNLGRKKNNSSGIFIHGRDLEGKPASHGCIGLYDEEMQKKYYNAPQKPELMDAKELYLWVVPRETKKKSGKINGLKVKIINKAP